MKPFYILTVIATMLMCGACKNQEKTEDSIPPKIQAPLETNEKECFQAVVERDTIMLSVEINSVNEFKGDLNYSYYLKDKSFGTVLGNVKGDTIFADYTFQSEGATSVKELAFLKTDENTIVEGYGDMIDANGKTVFKDKSKVKFDGNVIFVKTDCK